MAMHSEFSDWYRVASITPPDTLLEQRWKGVEDLAAGLNPTLVIDLLRLFVLPETAASSMPETAVEAFRKHDQSFSARGNSQELQVLAGAVLRTSFETNGPCAVTAAMGLVCGTFGKRYQGLATKDHVEAAEKYLAARAVQVREVKASWAATIPALTKDKYAKLLPSSSFEPNQTQAAHEQLFSVVADITARANQGLQQANTSIATLWQANQAQREELNFLWWLQAKLSRELGQPFQKISEGVASIVFPMELADLTIFLPGPDSILGLVLAALKDASGGKGSSKVSIAQAVNLSPRDWRERRDKLFDIRGFYDLCPIMFAITKSLETDGEAEWLPVYRKACDIGIEDPIESRQMAMQLYRERLFARSMAEVKK